MAHGMVVVAANRAVCANSREREFRIDGARFLDEAHDCIADRVIGGGRSGHEAIQSCPPYPVKANRMINIDRYRVVTKP